MNVHLQGIPWQAIGKGTNRQADGRHRRGR